MRRHLLFAASLLVCPFASGKGLTLADVKAKSAVQLGADDLKRLLTGAKVANQIPSGSTRRFGKPLGRRPRRVERRARTPDAARVLRLRHLDRRRQGDVLRAYPLAHANRRVVPVHRQGG